MQTDNNAVIKELLDLLAKATVSAQRFKVLDETKLNFKEDKEKWSILECIEHLNRYGDYYLPEMQRALLSDNARKENRVFKSGLLGNYFANLMKVKNGKITRMKTPADKNPVGSKLTVVTIDRFLKQQDLLRALLEQSRTADLTRIKVPISIAKFIKLRLGDTFRFFVYHIDRHIFQAENVVRVIELGE